MTRHVVPPLFLAVFLLLVATEGVKAGTLQGIVFDALTQAPIEGLTLQAESGTVVTNEDGRWTVSVAESPTVLSILVDGQIVLTSEPIPWNPGEPTEVLLTLRQNPFEWIRTQVETPGVGKSPEMKSGHNGDPRSNGELEGMITSGTGPVRGARIYVRGSDVEGKTNGKGHYSLKLPPGSHDITVLASGFGTQSMRTPEIVENRIAKLDIRMETASVQMAAFRVFAPYVSGSTAVLLRERQESAAVAEILGAEQMSRSGDSNAASALKRVTGVTLVGGRFVYVRGLGERYSSTVLNGMGLPSPEPDRRVVPLDLFSTHMLDSIVIQKTYSPDMPGEFSGGVVQLRSRRKPKEWLAGMDVSVGMNTGTTGEIVAHGPIGSTDWMGWDGGFREMPSLLREASAQMPIAQGDEYVAGYTKDDLTAIGRSLPNHWGVQMATVDPNLGAAAHLGGSESFLGGDAGFLLSFDYGNDWNLQREDIRFYTVGGEGQLEQTNRYDLQDLEREVQLSSFLTLEQEWKNHVITSNTVLARISNHNTRIYSGFNRDLGGDLRIRRTTWVERMLFSQQLLGHHTWLEDETGWMLDWGYALSTADRDEPGRRETRVDYEESQEDWFISNRPEGNQILYGNLDDLAHDVRIDGTFQFRQWTGEIGKLKWGGAWYDKEREVDVRRFKYRHKGPLSFDTDVIYQDPEDIFVPENIQDQGFQIIEVTLNTDSYRAHQAIQAGYLMGEVPLGAQLDWMGGARLESSDQFLSTFQPFASGEEETASLQTLDWMPATALTYRGWQDMNLRFGYSRTVTRPNFRELSPAVTVGLTGGRLRFGNPNLERGTIDNFDLRWEWFYGSRSQLALSGFFKKFTDPIETVIIPSAQLSVSYDNALGAENYGLELEWNQTLGIFHHSLDPISIGLNGAWIQSQVELCPIGEGENRDPRCAEGPVATNTSSERPLEGQSPFVVNVSGSGEWESTGTEVTLLYNVFGRRIVEVGALGSPDTYEEPFHQMDFVAKQALGAGFKLGFKARNLLNGEKSVTQGGLPRSTWRKGREFSLQLSWAIP